MWTEIPCGWILSSYQRDKAHARVQDTSARKRKNDLDEAVAVEGKDAPALRILTEGVFKNQLRKNAVSSILPSPIALPSLLSCLSFLHFQISLS